MNPRFLFTLVLFTSAAPFLHAQHSVGFDLELNRDLVKISDPGNEIKTSPRYNISPGLAYRFKFKNKFHISSGIRLKDYPHNFTSKHSFGTSSGSGNIALQLPIRLGRSFSLFNSVFISPELGIVYSRFLFETPGYGGGAIKTGADSLSYTWKMVNSQMNFFTLNLGLSFEIKFGRRFSMVFAYQYNRGFKPVSSEYVTYHLNQDLPVNAAQVHYGSYVTFLGVRLLFHLGKIPD